MFAPCVKKSKTCKQHTSYSPHTHLHNLWPGSLEGTDATINQQLEGPRPEQQTGEGKLVGLNHWKLHSCALWDAAWDEDSARHVACMDMKQLATPHTCTLGPKAFAKGNLT